ncbi:MAG: hypothetical protein JXA22_03455 [Candidatus Thermoplasmatota archaeon]|nr:hypothetical protein [Candidatus Thermoplasmatota archaeon]
MVSEFSTYVTIGIGYKEIAALLTIVTLLTVVGIASNYKEVDELVEPDISIDVQSSWSTYGPIEGQYPVDGKKWQVLSVNITNLNDDAAFQVSIPHFYGTTDSGDRIWVFNSEEYSFGKIDPGENVTVILVFDVLEHEVLTGLEYTQRVSGPLKCDVPLPIPYPFSDH